MSDTCRDQVNNMVNQQKQSQVQTLIKSLQSSNNFALVKFERTLHTTLETLRRDLKVSGSKLKVIKNALFIKALNKLIGQNKSLSNLKQQTKELKDNSALLLLGKDWSKGLSAFHKFSDKEKSLSFKIGVLDNQVYQTQDLIKIALLPSKEELIAKVIGSMKTPISKLNFSLRFNMQKFVYIINQKSKRESS